MFKKVFLFVLTIASVTAFADVSTKEMLTKCIDRVIKAGCKLSNNDAERIEDNVELCKHVSGKPTLEVFLLKDAQKLVVVNTFEPQSQYCPTIKYTIDDSGITDMKIIGNDKIGNRVFMISHAGRVYFMENDQDTYEVLNSDAKSYSGVVAIKGGQGKDKKPMVTLIGKTFTIPLEHTALTERIRKMKNLRKIEFTYSTTNRSLFRDE